MRIRAFKGARARRPEHRGQRPGRRARGREYGSARSGPAVARRWTLRRCKGPLREAHHRGRPGEGQRFAGGQAGAVEIGQVDLAVDQLAVAAVFDSGQVRENTASIGGIVGQIDPLDRVDR